MPLRVQKLCSADGTNPSPPDPQHPRVDRLEITAHHSASFSANQRATHRNTWGLLQTVLRVRTVPSRPGIPLPATREYQSLHLPTCLSNKHQAEKSMKPWPTGSTVSAGTLGRRETNEVSCRTAPATSRSQQIPGGSWS